MGFKEELMDSLDSFMEVRMGEKRGMFCQETLLSFLFMFICFVLLLNGGVEG